MCETVRYNQPQDGSGGPRKVPRACLKKQINQPMKLASV